MMALNLIMLGPPGAGKGTQAERFARGRGIPKVSTGDILRDAVSGRTEIGNRVMAIMDRGGLVSDDVMIPVVRERLERPDARAGFVLDGFPRTVAQAEALDSFMDGRGPLIVVDIVVPEAEIVRRLGSRMICRDCGANAGSAAEPAAAVADNVTQAGRAAVAAEAVAAVSAPAESERCRRCGGRLVQRADDSDTVVLERLKVYRRQTEPLVQYYSHRPTFRSVNGAQSPDQVAEALARAIDGAHRGGTESDGGGRP
jgi:adenylate kinase